VHFTCSCNLCPVDVINLIIFSFSRSGARNISAKKHTGE